MAEQNMSVNFDVFNDEKKAKIQVNENTPQVSSLFENIEKEEKKKRKRSKINTEGTTNKAESSYEDTYKENNAALKSVMMEIDVTQDILNEDLANIRKAKTMTKKYDYISSIATTKANLFGSKIAAIREMDNNITQAHNLELKRQKDLKMANDEDVDKQVLDLYKSFINTPRNEVPTFVNDNMITTATSFNSVPTGEFIPSTELTPQEHMMILENNPNVKTVVVYNQLTGDKFFDVKDLSTGMSVSNVDLPDPMLIENLSVDVYNGVARDTKLDITYPLFVI